MTIKASVLRSIKNQPHSGLVPFYTADVELAINLLKEMEFEERGFYRLRALWRRETRPWPDFSREEIADLVKVINEREPRRYYVIRTEKPNLSGPWPWKRALPPGCIRRFNNWEYHEDGGLQSWRGTDVIVFNQPGRLRFIRAQHIPGTDIFVEV